MGAPFSLSSVDVISNAAASFTCQRCSKQVTHAHKHTHTHREEEGNKVESSTCGGQKKRIRKSTVHMSSSSDLNRNVVYIPLYLSVCVVIGRENLSGGGVEGEERERMKTCKTVCE